jgi:hypothetical protein
MTADTNAQGGDNHFDLQAHRGGIGLTVESTLASLVASAASLGFDAISPVHGTPQNGTVTDANYVPYVPADMVMRARAAGMQVMAESGMKLPRS